MERTSQPADAAVRSTTTNVPSPAAQTAMKARLPLFPALSCLLFLGFQDPRPAAEGDLILRNVAVLVPEDGTVLRDRAVVIGEGRILRVASDDEVEAPDGAEIVDGAGLFLMPGMWDLHTHLSFADENAAPLMVTQGVTGARDMGAVPSEIETIREAIEGGEVLGPRILRAGPTLNGASFGAHQRVIGTPAEAEAAVVELKAFGVDLLKTHNATEREVYFALLRAAAAAGLQVAGHVPKSVSPLEACEAGQGSFEHIVTIFEGVYMARYESELEAFQSMDAWLAEEGPTLVSCLVERGTLFVPTLRTYEVRANRGAFYDQPPEGWEYLTDESREAYRRESVPSEADRSPLVIRLRSSLVEVGQAFARMLHAAGGAIGTGSDFAGPGLVPGYSIVREIELLVDAGLPNHAALHAATRGPGAGAGADPRTGRIENGAPADLVLLRANPFQDLSALRQIEGVSLRGRWLDREELDRILGALSTN